MTINLANLRCLLAAATPRPWVAELDCFTDEDGIEAIVADGCCELLAKIGTDLPSTEENWKKARDGQESKDATLIAAAVNALPELLDRIDEYAALLTRAGCERRP